MRTRTLLLLAVACGLAILLAGGIKLLGVVGEEDAPRADLPIGATASAGDASVTVLDATETGERLVVEVRVGGVVDPDGVDGFTLLAGAQIPPVRGASDRACGPFTVAEQTCELVFDTSGVVGDVRVLRFSRAGESHRWSIRTSP